MSLPSPVQSQVENIYEDRITPGQAMYLHQKVAEYLWKDNNYKTPESIDLSKISFSNLTDQDRKDILWAIYNHADKALEDTLVSLMK